MDDNLERFMAVSSAPLPEEFLRPLKSAPRAQPSGRSDGLRARGPSWWPGTVFAALGQFARAAFGFARVCVARAGTRSMSKIAGLAMGGVSALHSPIQSARKLLRTRRTRRAFVRWKVEEELCYVASEARFEREAPK
jgi:hypothetical protein